MLDRLGGQGRVALGAILGALVAALIWFGHVAARHDGPTPAENLLPVALTGTPSVATGVALATTTVVLRVTTSTTTVTTTASHAPTTTPSSTTTSHATTTTTTVATTTQAPPPTRTTQPPTTTQTHCLLIC